MYGILGIAADAPPPKKAGVPRSTWDSEFILARGALPIFGGTVTARLGPRLR